MVNTGFYCELVPPSTSVEKTILAGPSSTFEGSFLTEDVPSLTFEGRAYFAELFASLDLSTFDILTKLSMVKH